MANSWQSPVPGEPSLGTPHPPTLDSGNLRVLFTGAPATTPSVTEVAVGAYVPAGTKAIYIEGWIKTGDNTLTSLRASRTNAAVFSNGIWIAQGYGGAAFQYFPFSGLVLLDSAYKFWIYRENAGMQGCAIFLLPYFL